MPNASNILSPITLMAYGRSGTSLLHKCFESHPDCEAVGESSNLIFSTWHACELTRQIVRDDAEDRPGGARRDVERWSEAVRAIFLTTFESDKTHWFQKPIGMPDCINDRSDWGAEWPGFHAWYWDVFANVFPGAKCCTILRHPYDVILSACSFWGRDQATVVRDLAVLADCLTHPASRVTHVVSYDALVRDPEAALRDLCLHSGLPFSPAMLAPTRQLHVQRPGTHVECDDALFEQRKHTGFSRRAEWDHIDKDAIARPEWSKIEALWERFGMEL